MAAFRALLNRAFTHCTMLESRQQEIDWIVQQAIKHGYKANTISKLLRRMSRTKPSSNDRTDDRKTYSMDINSISLKFKKKLEKISGQKIVFNRNNTLFNLIRNDKDKISEVYFPGV